MYRKCCMIFYIHANNIIIKIRLQLSHITLKINKQIIIFIHVLLLLKCQFYMLIYTELLKTD